MAIKTVIGALRAGAMAILRPLIQAGARGASLASSILSRWPGLDRAEVIELGQRARQSEAALQARETGSPDSPIPKHLHARLSGQADPYTYQVTVHTFQPVSGESRDFDLLVRSQSQLSPNQIADDAIGRAADIVESIMAGSPALPGDEPEVVSWSLRSATRA